MKMKWHFESSFYCVFKRIVRMNQIVIKICYSLRFAKQNLENCPLSVFQTPSIGLISLTRPRQTLDEINMVGTI